jgi:hypothetical protein
MVVDLNWKKNNEQYLEQFYKEQGLVVEDDSSKSSTVIKTEDVNVIDEFFSNTEIKPGQEQTIVCTTKEAALKVFENVGKLINTPYLNAEERQNFKNKVTLEKRVITQDGKLGFETYILPNIASTVYMDLWDSSYPVNGTSLFQYHEKIGLFAQVWLERNISEAQEEYEDLQKKLNFKASQLYTDKKLSFRELFNKKFYYSEYRERIDMRNLERAEYMQKRLKKFAHKHEFEAILTPTSEELILEYDFLPEEAVISKLIFLVYKKAEPSLCRLKHIKLEKFDDYSEPGIKEESKMFWENRLGIVPEASEENSVEESSKEDSVEESSQSSSSWKNFFFLDRILNSISWCIDCIQKLFAAIKKMTVG